jgi:hypothetical protein
MAGSALRGGGVPIFLNFESNAILGMGGGLFMLFTLLPPMPPMPLPLPLPSKTTCLGGGGGGLVVVVGLVIIIGLVVIIGSGFAGLEEVAVVEAEAEVAVPEVPSAAAATTSDDADDTTKACARTSMHNSRGIRKKVVWRRCDVDGS